MKKILIFYVMATLCLISSELSSQLPTRLTGKVLSKTDGKPLAGATISIEGTTLTATTNENGIFVIADAPSNGTLAARYTGLKQSSISFSQTKRTLLIQLETVDNDLNEVTINAGYYSVKDKERTGTIAKVTSETISQQPVSNPLAALQGRVAGLVITQRSGLPGSNFSVQLRGRNSIESGTSPLYLIDGVPFPSDPLTQNSTIAANSPLNTINPSQIESIEVLKDADATAIYGSRGANGVILITTKKGKAGSTSAEFNLSAGIGKITRAVELMNTAEYIEMRKEAFANDKVTPTLSNAPDLLAWPTDRYTDMKDLLIGGTAQTQSARLRLSGGNESTSYTMGTNFYRETTVFPGDNALQRKDANLSISHRSADSRFKLNLSTAYSINNSALYTQDLTSQLLSQPNIPALYTPEGRLNWMENGASFTNPLGRTKENSNFKTNRFTSNARASYQLHPNLEIKATAGFNAINLNQYTNIPIASLNPATNPTGTASFADSMNETWIIEPQLDFNKDLKEWGKISVLVGTTWQETIARSSLIRGTGYTNDLLLGSIEASVNRFPTNAYSEYKYQAIYGRINYNLKGKYLINLTGRRDGSSRFGPGKQFANFGAIGTAWVMSDEPFMKTAMPFISFAKIRSSYGITGNDQINNYQFLDSYFSTVPYGNQNGLIPGKLSNPNYSWEENQKLEAAIELGFFNDRIRISAGWFRNNSGNQLVSYSLPAQAGFSTILRNLDAKIQNQGIEIEISSTNLKGNGLIWTTSANLTATKNLLVAFPGLASSSYANTYIIGQPLGIIRGYHYTGISQATGAYQFEDLNGDGQLNTLDYYPIGTKEPRLYGGLQNDFRYQGLSLNIFFQFARQKGTHLVYGTAGLYGSATNVPRELLDRWTPANPNARYQAYSQAFSGPINQSRTMIVNSDAALVDASFIRLKNVSLSYDLPKSIVKNIKLDNARLFIQGQNLLTITSFPVLDPESQSATILPPLRMFSFGIQINL